jgi:hypothetical protein
MFIFATQNEQHLNNEIQKNTSKTKRRSTNGRQTIRN